MNGSGYLNSEVTTIGALSSTRHGVICPFNYSNHWVFTALTAAHLLQPRHLLQHWPWTDFLEFKRFVTKIISTN